MSSNRVTYEIVKSYGVLSVSESGWTKELNLVSFNELEPKLDIREWSPDKTKMSKGIRISRDEANKLYELLAKEM